MEENALSREAAFNLGLEEDVNQTTEENDLHFSESQINELDHLDDLAEGSVSSNRLSKNVSVSNASAFRSACSSYVPPDISLLEDLDDIEELSTEPVNKKKTFAQILFGDPDEDDVFHLPLPLSL